mgnify:CR=1 FL=1
MLRYSRRLRKNSAGKDTALQARPCCKRHKPWRQRLNIAALQRHGGCRTGSMHERSTCNSIQPKNAQEGMQLRSLCRSCHRMGEKSPAQRTTRRHMPEH